jgi:hypothetical protein
LRKNSGALFFGEKGADFGAEAFLAMDVGCADEGLEEGVRLERLGLELGVELAAEEPRVVSEFADFDELAVVGAASDAEAV